jgi:hypothetical protein
MNGLFYQKEVAEYTTYHLLRFYENGNVIYKKVTGDDKAYLTKELKSFRMVGFDVKGEPEFTFCGSFEDYGDVISCKVENQIMDASDTWAEKDVLSFRGKFNEKGELELKKISKRTKFEVDLKFLATTDEALISEF